MFRPEDVQLIQRLIEKEVNARHRLLVDLHKDNAPTLPCTAFGLDTLAALEPLARLSVYTPASFAGSVSPGPTSPAASATPSSSSMSPAASPSSSMCGAIEAEPLEERRPHQCPDCLKRFRFKSNLFEHKTLHQRSTPFVCPFCAKTCRLKGNLKKHLQVHVGSSQELEVLWKARFSRSSGRPRKHPQHAQPELQPQQLPTPLARRPAVGEFGAFFLPV